MDKYYKMFYTTGSNNYYTLNADGDMFLATETVIPVKSKMPFVKARDMTQALKLLKCTSPLLLLFSKNAERVPLTLDEHLPAEMAKYGELDGDELHYEITKAYDEAIEEQLKDLDVWYRVEYERIKELSDNPIEALKALESNRLAREAHIKKSSPLNKFIFLKWKGEDKIVSAFRKNHNFLYSETIVPSLENVYLYNADAFGTLTIYQIILVRGVTKTINTFIYDVKLLNAFFESIYKNEK